MNLPICLNKTIGSRRTDWNLPSDFGLYVEQLAGVTQQELMAIRTPDYNSDGAFVADMINFSMSNIVQNLSQWLIQDFRQGSILDRADVGELPNTRQLTFNSPNGNDRGVTFIRTSNDFYGKLTLGRVYYLGNDTGAITLTISDNLGQIVTFTENATAGVPLEFQTNFQTQSGYISMTTDNSNTSTAYIPIACCGRSYNMSHRKGWRVEGWNGVSADTQTFGLKFEFTYECDQKQIACLFKNSVSFQQACLYRFGMDYCDQLATTPRRNPVTIHRTAEDIQIMRDKFETEMLRSLEMIRIEARQMLSRPNTHCIACNGTRYVETTGQARGNY